MRFLFITAFILITQNCLGGQTECLRAIVSMVSPNLQSQALSREELNYIKQNVLPLDRGSQNRSPILRNASPFLQEFKKTNRLLTLFTPYKTYFKSYTKFIASVLKQPEFAKTFREELLLSQLKYRMPLEIFEKLSAHAGSAHEMLSELSRSNLERLNFKSVELKLGELPESHERNQLDSILKRYSVNLVHNTVSMPNKSPLPLMSSGLIYDLGFHNGLNTHSFNREVMKSHDNVFFHIDPTLDHAHTRKSNEYGGHSIAIKDMKSANENGMVSYFVMYEPEMKAYLKDFMGHAVSDGGEITPNLLQELHRFDFTLADTSTLQKQAIAETMVNLLQSNPAKAKHILDLLENSPTLERSAFLKQLVQHAIKTRYPNGEFRLEYKYLGYVGWDQLEIY